MILDSIIEMSKTYQSAMPMLTLPRVLVDWSTVLKFMIRTLTDTSSRVLIYNSILTDS